MNAFVYDNPTRVYFGEGQLRHLGTELGKYGSRVLVVYGGGSIEKNGLLGRIDKEIRRAGMEIFTLPGIEPNPDVSSVDTGAEICRTKRIDVILAVGGGSVLDAAKCIGVAAKYDGPAWDLVTRKAPVAAALPVVTVLTLAATGSEMNDGSVISNRATDDKMAFMHPLMRPKASFLDPTLTCTVSPYQTAAGSADIISHVLETYFCPEADLALLDTMMAGLLRTVIRFAPKALHNGHDYEARANLMWAASWGLNGFLNGGKKHMWSVHPMEHGLSAYHGMTHGHGLAILTPRWMEYVLDEETAPRFRQLGCAVFNINADLPAMDAANECIRRLSQFFFSTLGLQSTFSELGIGSAHFAIMAEKACNGGILPGFKALTQQDIETIYRMCL